MADSVLSNRRSIAITLIGPPKTVMVIVNIREHSSDADKRKFVQTRPGICHKKTRYASAEDALLAGRRAPFRLTPYRCGLCRLYHLTSRTKGMFVSRKCDKASL